MFGWRLIGTVNANTTSFVDRIQPTRDYRYRVRAVNSQGHSGYTNTISYTSPGAIIINDPLDNFNLIEARSSRVEIATPQTTPLKYDRDLNFVSSSSATPEYLIYHQPNLKDFTIASYATRSNSANFEVNYYSSMDGINWLPIEVNLNRTPTNLGQNTDVIFTTPTEILPDLTAYLKIEFSGIINLEEGIGNIKLIAAAN